MLSALLGEELRNFPTERLSLCIACRTAEWPASLEHRLRKLWGAKQFRVLELAPLLRLDVIAAAKSEDIDSEKFLDAIRTTRTTALAIKPVTLQFLLRTFARNGSFPHKQADLYGEGCRLLCEETNEDRREVGHTGHLQSNNDSPEVVEAGHVARYDGQYSSPDSDHARTAASGLVAPLGNPALHTHVDGLLLVDSAGTIASRYNTVSFALQAWRLIIAAVVNSAVSSNALGHSW